MPAYDKYFFKSLYCGVGKTVDKKTKWMLKFLRLLNVTVVFQKDSNNFSRLIGDVVHLYVPATKMHH